MTLNEMMNMNNTKTTTNLKAYLEVYKQNVVQSMSKETALEFLNIGFHNRTLYESDQNNETLFKNPVLEWWEKHHKEMKRYWEEITSRQYAILEKKSFHDAPESFQKSVINKLLDCMKKHMIDSYAIDFLIQNGYEIVDDDFLFCFLFRIDEKHLTDWDLQNALEETIEDMKPYDEDDDE